MPSAIEPNDRIAGRYEVVRRLGGGGMGEVFLATDLQLGRPVAVKLLPEEFSSDPARLRRFMAEARLASSINHPNAAHIYDLGESDGTHFIVLEYVDGASLDQRIGTLSMAEAVEIALQLARALDAAHVRHVIHRDIKPANVVLTSSGQVKLLDFGLAKLNSAAADLEQSSGNLHLTQPGMVVGTVPYLSPEQAVGAALDHRTDLFSFGVLLYELLTARRPFQGQNAVTVIDAILHAQPLPPGSVNPAIPPELDRIVMRCLAKRVDDRYASAALVAADLQALPAGIPTVTAGPDDETVTVAASPSDARRSIGVMPFADLSPGGDQQYLCDGFAEEISLALARVPDLRVAARSATFAHRDADVRQVGRHLGVETLLEGTVRTAGSRLRVSVRLTDVADGFQLWTERYDRTMEDIFDVQEEIATHVCDALQLRLRLGSSSAILRDVPRDVRSYEHYLRGRDLYYRHTRGSYESAIESFQRAIAIDPSYARAHAGIAQCHAALYQNFGQHPADLEAAERSASMAVQLAPKLGEAHVARALVYEMQGDVKRAEEDFARARATDPSLFEAHYFLANLLRRLGRTEEAAQLYLEAHRVRPEDYTSVGLAANVYDGLQRPAEAATHRRRAVETLERHLRLAPDDAKAMIMLGNSLMLLGERDRGIEFVIRGAELAPNEPLILYNVACGFALIGESDRAIDYLQRAVANGFGDAHLLAQDSDFDQLRADPRFTKIASALAKRFQGETSRNAPDV